ncbi:MAG TPA: hemolysin III family protein [Gemmataceae bacterium]|jgi:hemolysin III|nr:hemolysin III family protein [Gemmataceae bacterium]
MAMEIQPFLGLRQPVSALTHALGFAAACWATVLFHRRCRGDVRKWLAFECFALCMVAAYLASTLYHAVRATGEHLLFFRRLDHTGIYLLIAGTFTPALGIALGHQRRWRLMVAMMWLAAIVGISCKWLFAFQPYWISISLYAGLGWLGFMPLQAFRRVLGSKAAGWALAGGVCYTIGGLADLNGWPIVVRGVFGSHEFMHLCTLAGSACHCVFLMRYVIPFELGPSRILPGSVPDPEAQSTKNALTTSGFPDQRPKIAG